MVRSRLVHSSGTFVSGRSFERPHASSCTMLKCSLGAFQTFRSFILLNCCCSAESKPEVDACGLN